MSGRGSLGRRQTNSYKAFLEEHMGGSDVGNNLEPGDVVLEAGAVIAVLTQGPGYEMVETRLAAPGFAVIDAASLLDAMIALSERGLSQQEIREVIDALALRVENVDEDLARRAVKVAAEDGAQGISLSRLCSVALGRKLGVPVLAMGPELEDLEGVEAVSRSG